MDLNNENNNVLISCFPNPVVTTTVIHIQNSSGGLEFRMFDYTGKLVSVKQNLSDGDYNISNTALNSGVYFYEVLHANKKVGGGKLVVQ